MQIYLDLLLLTTIVVFIVDVSDFVDALKAGLSRIIGKKIERLKPFDCSLCMTWWAGILYLSVNHALSLSSVAFVAIIASCAIAIGNLIMAWRMLLQKAADWLMDILE